MYRQFDDRRVRHHLKSEEVGMSDQTQQTPAQTQVVPPAPEGCLELQVTYPCTFPKCKSVLDVDVLYVPPITWINREVGRRRPVTDWFSQATPDEMAEYARCKHHALESVVGLEYNRRKGIAAMTGFGDVLRHAQHMRELAQIERDQQAEAYRAEHEREKQERREKREAAKRSRPGSVRQVPAKPKNYGDARPHVAAEPASGKKKGKKQKGPDDKSKKKGGR